MFTWYFINIIKNKKTKEQIQLHTDNEVYTCEKIISNLDIKISTHGLKKQPPATGIKHSILHYSDKSNTRIRVRTSKLFSF